MHRPTAYSILCLSGATEPTLTRVSAWGALLAEDARKRAQASGLRMLCRGNVPTRTGTPSTTITDPDDSSQVVAENAT
jgi:hypothetical protein